MVSTNSQRNSVDVPPKGEEEVEEEPYKSVSLFDLYKLLSGPYYLLLFVGFASAVAGGKVSFLISNFTNFVVHDYNK